MIPAVVTAAAVDAEFPAVTAWAARRPGWAVRYDATTLILQADTIHPLTSQPIAIAAELTGYRAVPPAWTITGTDGTFPAGGQVPGVPGSIFHPNRLICAPWNRLAYGEHGGPHADWGGQTNWTDAGTGNTKADTLADMLSQIALHLAGSPGMS
jgi:hypothetical protein